MFSGLGSMRSPEDSWALLQLERTEQVFSVQKGLLYLYWRLIFHYC